MSDIQKPVPVDYPDLYFELPHLGTPWAMVCRVCGRVTYNAGDIYYHYCNNCKTHLDDVWPPARQSVLYTIKHWRKEDE